MSDHETTVDTLNSLLRGELSAVETYRQAEEKFEGEIERADLGMLRDEHDMAASLLSQHIRDKGGVPSETSGAWGTFAGLIQGTAQVFGKAAALEALERGEKQGVGDYEAALEDAELPSECRNLIADALLPRCREHVAQLDRILSQQA